MREAIGREERHASKRKGAGSLIAIVLGGLLGACGANPGGPSGLQGTYRLLELDGQPLPYDRPLGCCIYTAGSLAFESQRYEAMITFQNKNNRGVFRVSEQGSYSLRGTTIDFQRTAGDVPLFLYDAHLEGSDIRLFLGGDGPGAADQFRALFRR